MLEIALLVYQQGNALTRSAARAFGKIEMDGDTCTPAGSLLQFRSKKIRGSPVRNDTESINGSGRPAFQHPFGDLPCRRHIVGVDVNDHVLVTVPRGYFRRQRRDGFQCADRQRKLQQLGNQRAKRDKPNRAAV